MYLLEKGDRIEFSFNGFVGCRQPISKYQYSKKQRLLENIEYACKKGFVSWNLNMLG